MSKGGTVASRIQSAFGGPPLFFWFLDTRWSIASARTPHHLLRPLRNCFTTAPESSADETQYRASEVVHARRSGKASVKATMVGREAHGCRICLILATSRQVASSRLSKVPILECSRLKYQTLQTQHRAQLYFQLKTLKIFKALEA
ncbi:hypothetical protein CROQUDRAFT_85794 [Cronartium quercuum f. sp. fusiforme G11]|uniref:Uncharacterized protein n=1 Tax=Cronartium quercuum f. sp. fusiforme G11 TaxID=708437 RepID=A0A9P6NUB3_9BASI|nr:hypothetical protein CROQUDRAFT_85794 [Cronartium quercuum f. sp. fusiforme G11]